MSSIQCLSRCVVASLLLACQLASASEDELRTFTEEGRKLSTQLLTQIRGELTRELERTGPVRAIIVCKYSVPEITSSISRQTGMRVTRVGLRPRNPALGEADIWEQGVLLEFEKRVSKGEKAETLEFSEIVQQPTGRAMRYMKAIPMGQPCMTCHGPANQISEAVKAQLANEYPKDRAVEYQVGQVRGAVSIKKTLKD